ncbi:cobalamin biosynthesis protein [Zavarzinia compransoris]|uniref:cobalamin biosynthesis protein n=1 Tax=Zavarzinia marina TaxID=2911065 RepID=UPI001F3A54E6|nr:cobalamin biosynthesis protein [Zavarzinia marina]MCF4167390.1 cobalamin biosynthesis protein [Zavarzinia marina]
MRVAGIGFRRVAGIESLRAALDAAGGTTGVSLLATAAEKAEAPVLLALARDLGLPLRAVPRDLLSAQATATRSARTSEAFGTGSVAEAAALAAAGPGARLVAPRAVSPDGMATAAIAETEEP